MWKRKGICEKKFNRQRTDTAFRREAPQEAGPSSVFAGVLAAVVAASAEAVSTAAEEDDQQDQGFTGISAETTAAVMVAAIAASAEAVSTDTE